MKKRVIVEDENMPANPYAEVARHKFFKPDEALSNPFSRQYAPVNAEEILKNQRELQYCNQLLDFVPIIEEWKSYISDIITENYSGTERSDHLEVIEDNLIVYEKKHPNIYSNLCEKVDNLTDLEKDAYSTMKAIKTFDAQAPLNFEDKVLSSIRKKLLTFYNTVHSNMGLFIRHQKALQDYLSSCLHDPSAVNIRIIISSISKVEDFIQGLWTTFNKEKQTLEEYIKMTEKFLSTDPIACYINTELKNRLEYLEENLIHVTEFRDICHSKKQNLNLSLGNISKIIPDDELDFDYESLSSSSDM